MLYRMALSLSGEADQRNVIMLDAQTQTRVENVEARMRERGVVDVKFFKDREKYLKLSPNEQMNEVCDVIEAMLDGRCKPAEPLYDSVRGVEHPSLRGLLGEADASPITLSPVARCGGGRNGDHHEEEQKGGTTAP